MIRPFSRPLGFALCAMILATPITALAQRGDFDFAKRQEAIKAKLKTNKAKSKFVHNPPMIQAAMTDLFADQPVIGVAVKGDARAYPLSMLFGGAAIFELLNDTCGGEPIAVSW